MNDTQTESADRFDPRSAEQLLEQTERQAESALNPDSRKVYLVWSVAWFVAMIGSWLGSRPGGPFSDRTGTIIYSAALTVGIGYTIYEASTKQRGIGGRSRTLGRLWGISWAVAWGSWALVMGGISQVAGSGGGDVIETLAPASATIVVGALYLQGGAFWPRSQMMLPGWLLMLVGGGATFAGPVNHYLVLGIGGAICFLIGALRTSGADEPTPAMVA